MGYPNGNLVILDVDCHPDKIWNWDWSGEEVKGQRLLG